MQDIQKLTQDVAASRRKLVEKVRELDTKTAALRRQYLPSIRSLTGKVAESIATLKAAIDANRSLFARPRSITVDGIKAGLQKQKGKIDWKDDSLVVKLIKKHFPERADELIDTVETPNKTALERLTASELKKIGVEIRDSTDEVLIKTTDSDIDKLVKALLKDKEEETLPEVA